MSDVALISMPFGPHMSPSIALSLLQAGLNDQRISSRIHYFSLRFAELIGESLYSSIATDSGKPSIRELAGEWLFREALFGEEGEDKVESYVDEILRHRRAWPEHAGMRRLPESMIGRLLRIRQKIPLFLDRCTEEVITGRPAVVGFSSVFQQHVASLALASRIKRLAPQTSIVFGGANCEGVMGAETVRQFPFVDAAVSGEGDLIFSTMVRRCLNGQSLEGMAGVRTHAGIDEEYRLGTFTNAPMVLEMDRLPTPEYADYFDQFGTSRFEKEWQPGLYFESSRGCWWGERMHCAFCGLNGTTMQYRSKSSGRALDELRDLSQRYPGCDVQVTDNILDMKYFDDFIPALAGEKLNIELFYETKSNLKKRQIRALRAAGIRRIQPGIESLSDSVLKLMRKGVSALQNIQLLKWCKELGVKPYWNFLWGFPGEEPAAYDQMTDLIPQLRHLPPPVGVSGIRLDRFSPNFSQAPTLGFDNVRPLAPYEHIYPFPRSVISNLAYYFAFDYRDGQNVDGYVGPLLKALRAWQRAGPSDEVVAFDDGAHLSIWDLRREGAQPLTTLGGLERFLYLRCDSADDIKSLVTAARQAGFDEATETLVAERLGPLIGRHLLLRDGNRYLALAIPVGEYRLSRDVVSRLSAMARQIGHASRRRVVVPLNEDHLWNKRASPSRARGQGQSASMNAAPHHSVNDQSELVIQF
jgi:ribosomal peptide maturation radical SAM protein 1